MTVTMTGKRARIVLLAMFFSCLAVQILIVALNSGSMWQDEVQEVLLKLLAVYSVPLSIIAGGIFARGSKTAVPAYVCWAALALAGLWNLLLLWRAVAFGLTSDDTISDFLAYVDAVSSAAMFLIAGSLAYFFGKSVE